MDKKVLRHALINSCIRLLNTSNLTPQSDEKSYQMILRNIREIATTLDTLNKDLTFIPLHPDIMAEALAYECKKQQPNPEVIIHLTLLLQKQ